MKPLCVYGWNSMVVSRIMRKFVSSLGESSQPARDASFSASKCFMFMYFLLPHCVPAT